MEYRKKYPLEFNPSVRVIQRELNVALGKAYQMVNVDKEYRSLMISDCHYFEKIRHMEYVPSIWKNIIEDGLYGNDTENAVKGFQQFCYISINGIMGDYTRSLLEKIIILEIPNNSKIKVSTPQTRANLPNKNKISGKVDSLLCFFNGVILNSWNNFSISTNGICFFLGNGFIVLSEHLNSKTTLHINLDKIVQSLLLPEYYRPGKWFHVNDKSVFRQFKAYNVSKTIESLGTPFSNLSLGIGVTGILVDYVDVLGKIYQKKLKFTDIAKVGFNTICTTFDLLLRNARSTARVPIQQASIKLGQELLKYKFAVKIFGTAAAAGTVVVFVQCAGAIMLGVDIGKWIESKTHCGEIAVNFYWELFIGDLFEKACQWQADRVVCVKYPDDWTDSQIQDFQNRFK